jgi:hypothetical protein
MVIYEYGESGSSAVLIQMVDDHDLAVIENELAVIRKSVNDFKLVALKVDNWNLDLSPWKAPAVFGKEEFSGGAAGTLVDVLKLCADDSKSYYIGGYSLAGLFALWAAYQTDRFAGVAAASPSLWFPNFVEYMKNNEIKSNRVYLSLGDKEEKVRNPVMATVGEKIREAYDCLVRQEVNCTLEWNQGNHFKEPDVRTAKAFAWLLENSNKG